MKGRPHADAALRGVRVFLVRMAAHESVATMLRALGADVRCFQSLSEADLAAVPTGTTVLVARLVLADEHDAEPVTFVVSGFGVPGVLRPVCRPSFGDRFVEVHRGHPEASLLCASIIRAAGLPADGGGYRQPGGSGHELRLAI